MRHVNDTAHAVYDGRALENERELLRSLWEQSGHKQACFVSIDLEGPRGSITELGLAFQSKNGPRRVGRHIIVQGTQHLKRTPLKPCGFGLTSEKVGESEELYTILDDLFTHRRRVSRHVILTGFDIKSDLLKLDSHCGWRPPVDVIIIDAAVVYRALSGKATHPSQAAALETLGFPEDPTAPFHNAANDAWYALELLSRMAEQAVRQVEDPDGGDTIDWLAPTSAPPPSAALTSASTGPAAALSFPFGRSAPACTPRHPPPSGRLKRRREQRGVGPGDTIGTTGERAGETSSITPADGRPAKKPRLTEESQGFSGLAGGEGHSLGAKENGKGRGRRCRRREGNSSRAVM